MPKLKAEPIESFFTAILKPVLFCETPYRMLCNIERQLTKVPYTPCSNFMKLTKLEANPKGQSYKKCFA